jgi:hypothetical protein
MTFLSIEVVLERHDRVRRSQEPLQLALDVEFEPVRIRVRDIVAEIPTPMEMHPRPVDVPVKRAVGESYTARDAQLDTAIAELVKQLGSGSKRSSP